MSTDPEELIREIYKTTAQMKAILSNEQLLLTEQWVGAYKKVSNHSLRRIKKEVKMKLIETTITEHYINQGKIEGKIKGKIETFENLYIQEIMTKKQFEEFVSPLRMQLTVLLPGNGE